MLSLNIPLIILIQFFVYNEEISFIKIAIIVSLFIAILAVKVDPNEKLVIKKQSLVYLGYFRFTLLF